MTALPVARSGQIPNRRSLSDGVVRALDIVISVVSLVVLSPLLIAIGLTVRSTSRGPAVFQQRRLGREQKPFTMLKFRTMYAGAPETAHRDYVEQLIRGDEHAPGSERLYKLLLDERVTRVGHFLRRTSLDELPQLYNVVRGQMSLVGPRPVTPYEGELYPDEYAERFLVKPGLTGLWQVSGRNRHTYHEMLQLDVEYVRRRSLRVYLRVLVRTIPALLRMDSA